MKSTLLAVFSLVFAQLVAQVVAQSAHAGGCANLKYRKVDEARLKELMEFQEPLNVTDVADIQVALVGHDTDKMWEISSKFSTSKGAEDAKGLYTLTEKNFSEEKAGELLDSIEVVKSATGNYYFRSMKTKSAFRHLTLAAVYKHVLKEQKYTTLDGVFLHYTESVEGAIQGRVNIYRKFLF